MFELSEEFFLIHDRGDTPLLDDSAFVHFLHGEELLFFLPFDFPHLAKAASADHVVKLEVAFVYCYKEE